MPYKFSSDKIQEISKYFMDYKNDPNLTTQKIAYKLEIDRTSIGNHFRKLFGEEYTKISEFKAKHIRSNHSSEGRLKISKALKGKPKPPRSLQHRVNLSKAFSRSYVERFGEKRAKIITDKIAKANRGKKRIFKNKDIWKANLSNSLKGRKVWNKGKKGLQKAWNKKDLPDETILDAYNNKNLSSYKIADDFNCSIYTILRILKKNNVKLKGIDFIKGKKLEEIVGKERADQRKRIISEKLKGRKYNWGPKISEGIKKYYEKCRVNNYKIHRKRGAYSEERRLKLSIAKKKYLKEHPEELKRLREIQYPGKITKIEQKMLDFLKKRFNEGEDFHFDKQDITGRTFYRPDFQFPKHKIIIELDGYYRHFTKEGYIKDRIREYYLKKAGWKVYRFNFYDIEREYKFEEVKNKIFDMLKI